MVPSFREEVLRLRKDIGIPAEGVLLENSDESREACMQLNNKIRRATDAHMKRGDSAELAPLNLLYYGIRKIVKRYELPASFCETLEYFIKYNDAIAPHNNFQVLGIPDRDGRMGTYIKINGILTTAEKAEAYKRAEEEFLYRNPLVKTKYKRRRNLERDIELFLELTRTKGTKTVQDVVTEFWEYNGEDHFDKSSDLRRANLVRQAVRRIQKELRKRFPKEDL